ncbi:MAG TPA: hypothetical protein VMR80_04460, partial [Candidatus Acidoferrum sp.]|nr:hypothetical protein [Candidatus Acidoferrum sp.]
ERRLPRVLVGNDAKLLAFLERVAPIQPLDSQVVIVLMELAATSDGSSRRVPVARSQRASVYSYG